MAISTNASNTYDPTASAQALTDKYTADLQARITAQTKAATATSIAAVPLATEMP